MRSALPLLLVSLLTFVTPAAAAEPFVWWEGERPAKTNFPPNSPFTPAWSFPARAGELSGGDWLSTGGKRGTDALFAAYNVDVPGGGGGGGGAWHLWCRKFWAHGPFRWRFDDQPWQTCETDAALADDVSLGRFVNANWVSLGDVTVTGGRHAFRVELLAKAGEETACGFDCFAMVRGPFLPAGKLKPGQRSGRADDGFFPFEPGLDPFRGGAALDLRKLNESSAGVNGPLRRNGDHFALGDGRPVRFWAVDVSNNNAAQSRAAVDYFARKLAKAGVNMVRFHGPLFDGADPTRVSPKQLDHLMYLVAAMKREGIYTYLSFYFPLWVDARNPKLGLPAYAGQANGTPFGLVYFDPKMQAIYRGWADQILTTPDPYNGGTLAAEPALGIVEAVNEDSLFFWTFTKKNLPPAAWRELEGQFTAWAANRYRTVAGATTFWGGTLDGDTADHLGLVEAWGMTGDGAKRFGVKRVADQVRFLAETQRAWYAGVAEHLHRDLGYHGLVNASNWVTADAAQLGAVERWTYDAGDVADQHGYFNAPVTGTATGSAVRAGDTFTDAASVLTPAAVPLRFHRTAGRPMIETELGWTNPNRLRADGVFLSAAYGSLQGADGLFFFLANSNYGADSSLNKFGVTSPVVFGQFPAAALVYRRGDVATGDPVVHQVVSPADLFALRGSATFAGDALDELRKGDVPAGGVVPGPVGKVDDFAAYVGPVERAYTDAGPAGTPYQRDLSRYVDRRAKTIASDTGQLRWDYGIGVARVDTPLAQGAAGFLSKVGVIDLGDVRVTCENGYGSVLVVSLDGKPLRASRDVLVQVVTREQPVGFATTPAAKGGETIADLGSSPFGVERVRATVAFKGGATATLTALDENGYPRGPGRPVGAEGSVQLFPDAIYQRVTR